MWNKSGLEERTEGKRRREKRKKKSEREGVKKE